MHVTVLFPVLLYPAEQVTLITVPVVMLNVELVSAFDHELSVERLVA